METIPAIDSIRPRATASFTRWRDLSERLLFEFSPKGNQSQPQAWNAKNIEWQKTDPGGTKWSVLEGRSDVAGEAFTYAAFLPAGFHDFHSHASDTRVAVIQGVLKVCFGKTSDLDHLKSYPVGSFVFVPVVQLCEHTPHAGTSCEFNRPREREPHPKPSLAAGHRAEMEFE
jgi:hypothetical protein